MLQTRFCKMLKQLSKYIFRGWDEETNYTPTRFKILPPFFYELLAYLIGASILYQLFN